MLKVTYNQTEKLNRENKLSCLCDIRVNGKDIDLGGYISIQHPDMRKRVELYYTFEETGSHTARYIKFIPENWDYLEDEFQEAYVDQLDDQEIINMSNGIGEVTDRVWETPSYNKYWYYFVIDGFKFKVDIQRLDWAYEEIIRDEEEFLKEDEYELFQDCKVGKVIPAKHDVVSYWEVDVMSMYPNPEKGRRKNGNKSYCDMRVSLKLDSFCEYIGEQKFSNFNITRGSRRLLDRIADINGLRGNKRKRREAILNM